MRHGLHGSMELLPQPRGPWTNIIMDCIIGLPNSRQQCHAKPHNTILIVVDLYIKQVRYFPCYFSLDAMALLRFSTESLFYEVQVYHEALCLIMGPITRLNSKQHSAITYKSTAGLAPHSINKRTDRLSSGTRLSSSICAPMLKTYKLTGYTSYLYPSLPTSIEYMPLQASRRLMLRRIFTPV
jgi:hypothetical protein